MFFQAVRGGDVALDIDRDDKRCSGEDQIREIDRSISLSYSLFRVRLSFPHCFDVKSMLGFGEFV